MADVSRIETETDRADRHKAAITELLKPLVVACEAARRDGFYAEFGVQINQFGVYTATPVGLIKRF